MQFRREAPGHGAAGADRPARAGGDAPKRASASRIARSVSRDLSAILDVEDVVPTAYTLEVSSPGLDRPLRGRDDYRRFAGRRAKLVMREAVDGQRFFKGTARRRRGPATCSSTATTDGTHRVPLGVITRANLEVEF